MDYIIFIVHLAKGDTEEKRGVAFVSVEIAHVLYKMSYKSILQLLDKLFQVLCSSEATSLTLASEIDAREEEGRGRCSLSLSLPVSRRCVACLILAYCEENRSRSLILVLNVVT